MVKVVLKRCAFGVVLLFVVSAVTFVLVALSPGNAAHVLAGPNATQAQYEAVRQQLGLNEPITVQYWHWLKGALHGDFGSSIVSGQSVTQMVTQRLGVTLSLVIPATVIAALGGILAGTISAYKGGALGKIVDVGAVTTFAVPNYWLALILATVFAVRFHLFPSIGYVSITQSPGAWLRSITLPVITLALGGVAGIAKQTRDAMLTTLSSEFVLGHRADGVPERTIVFRHALRNCAAPILAMIGLFFVGLLGGTILVEQVFSLPGLGSLAVSASSEHDVPVIQAIAVCFAVLVVIVNLVLDLVFRRLNPKVELS